MDTLWQIIWLLFEQKPHNYRTKLERIVRFWTEPDDFIAKLSEQH
jgi:hypothetical protein